MPRDDVEVAWADLHGWCRSESIYVAVDVSRRRPLFFLSPCLLPRTELESQFGAGLDEKVAFGSNIHCHQ